MITNHTLLTTMLIWGILLISILLFSDYRAIKADNFLQKTKFPIKVIGDDIRLLTPVIFKDKSQLSDAIYFEQSCYIGKGSIIASVDRRIIGRKYFIAKNYVTLVLIDNTDQHSSNSENCGLNKYYSFVDNGDFLTLIDSIDENEKKLLKEQKHMKKFLNYEW